MPAESDSLRQGDEPEERLAPHGLRLLAFLIDVLFFALVVGAGLALDKFTDIPAWPLYVAAAAGFVYYMTATVWLMDGQTAGKAVSGLRVRRIDGAGPSPSLHGLAWSLGRHSLGYVVADVLLLGSVAALLTPRRRCVHDYAFGSEVVLVRLGERTKPFWARYRTFWEPCMERYEEVAKQYRWVLWPWKWLTRVVSIVGAWLIWIKDAVAAGSLPPASAAPAAKPLSVKGMIALWTAATVATGAAITGVVASVSEPDQIAAGWARITPMGVNFGELGLARGRDGALHVIWAQSDGRSSSLWHQAISPTGAALRSPDLVVGGWESITDSPDVVATPDGRLHAFFAGRWVSKDLLGVAVATSDSGGKKWTAPRRASAGTTWSYVATPGGGVAADGTSVVAWTTISHTPLYRFLGAPANPDVEFGSGCCISGEKIVTDAVTRQTALGWYWSPLGSGESGFYVQRISPTKLIGASSRAPDAASSGLRTAITARHGAPGIFLAYASADGTAINLWRYGDAAAGAVAHGSDLNSVGMSAGPEGRLWVFWESGEHYYATRSNREATQFGRVVSVPSLPGALRTYNVFGEGSLGPLDLFAHVQTSTGSFATSHRRVLPGLTLTCTSGSPTNCRVFDAGEPVRDATLRVGNEALTTDARGVASVRLPAGLNRIVASKSGYAPDSVVARRAE